MEPTDNDLMLAVRDGDVEAFGVLFDRHHQRLWDFFYRLSCDAAAPPWKREEKAFRR